VTDQHAPFFKIITNDFRPNLEVDYTFQYIYRINDISKFFFVEVGCSIGLLLFFFQVLYIYIDQYKGPLNDFQTIYNTTLEASTTKNAYDGSGCCYDFYSLEMQPQFYNIEIRKELFDNSRVYFRSYYWQTILVASCLLYSILLKLLFNSCASLSRSRMSMSA
jgi:hypothetical protein